MITGKAEGGVVSEIQGLYGPFTFPEKLLQQIWLRGEFDRRAARTVDGRVLQVLDPGRWNGLGGPDFRGARLKLGDVLVRGDVEVHLRAEDWAVHGHAGDPAYRDVVLHVVLFPVKPGYTTVGAGGATIPMVALLPWLHHDLEEFAAEEAIERLADHPLARAHGQLAALSPQELETELRRAAALRWRRKVHYAAARVERLGWEGACHQTALEILGYRFNRAAMLDVAAAFPFNQWLEYDDGLIERALAHAEERWSKQGTRPANRPRARLAQYGRWARACPSWPSELVKMAEDWSTGGVECEVSTSVGRLRRLLQLSVWREKFAAELCGGVLGGTRFETLVCDGFLPLAAARVGAKRLEVAWFAWFPGDMPERLAGLLRALGVVRPPTKPFCHGIFQGLLGVLLELEQNSPEKCVL